MTHLHATSGHAGHGPHLPPAQPEHDAVEWLPPSYAMARARELLWTCQQCKPVYYLLIGGGRIQIRRVTAQGSAVNHPMSYADGRDLWDRILMGHAR